MKAFRPDDLIVYLNKGTGERYRVKFRKYIGFDKKFAVVERPKDYVVMVVKVEDIFP